MADADTWAAAARALRSAPSPWSRRELTALLALMQTDGMAHLRATFRTLSDEDRRDLISTKNIEFLNAVRSGSIRAGAERAYFMRMLTNLAIDLIREERRRRGDRSARGDGETGYTFIHDSTEVFDLLRQLSNDDIELAWLRVEGCTPEEIAEALGLTRGATYKRIERLQQKVDQLVSCRKTDGRDVER
ncbi:hypothetical protein L6R52_35895 [Myxococcota bacterium]|nr:hypothetical protein [Myxococcota bacterium]